MSSTKKDDLPAMPFYVGDWLKAPDIQCLSYELKGLWFEMLCYMWESNERGYLLYTHEELSRLLRLPQNLLEQKLIELSNKKIFSVRILDGAIYCRKMARDQEIRELRTKAGSLGGRRTFAKHFAQANMPAQCENESESEYEIETKTQPKTSKGVPRIFIPPTIEQIKIYCQERGNKVNPQYFFDRNTATGWVDKNGNKYKDWKAVIRTWESFKEAIQAPPAAGKRPVMLVVVEKIAAGMSNHDILHDLVGTYTEHDINEALIKVRSKGDSDG